MLVDGTDLGEDANTDRLLLVPALLALDRADGATLLEPFRFMGI